MNCFANPLINQVYTGPRHTAHVWDDGSGYNYLVLSNPRLDSPAQRLRILSEGEAKVGTPSGENRCILLLGWVGVIEVFQKPFLDPRLTAVSFQTVESNLYTREGEKNLPEGKLWDQVKNHVHPQLAQVQINLQSLLMELRHLFPFTLLHQEEQIRATARSLTLSEVQTTANGIKITLDFTLPKLSIAESPSSPEPVLSPEEFQQWETIWQFWDAFLTFVIKHVAAASQLEELRLSLLEILLDARYGIIAAGDALKMLDQLGPEASLEISTDGLRRLARTIAPWANQDPLFYSFKVNPNLRRSFGFSPPLPSPKERPALSFINRWFWRNAWAADGIDNKLRARLNRWAPSVRDIRAYFPLACKLLAQTRHQIFSSHRLAPHYNPYTAHCCWPRHGKKAIGGSLSSREIPSNRSNRVWVPWV